MTPTNVNEINFNGYANLKVDDEFQLQGANIHADLDGDSLGLRASISDFFAVNENFPIHLHGFTFPHLDLTLAAQLKFPVRCWIFILMTSQLGKIYSSFMTVM